MSRIVVDRIEGPYAVLEIAGHLVPVPIAALPPDLWDLREGEILHLARPAPEALPVDAPPSAPPDAPADLPDASFQPPSSEGIARAEGSPPSGVAILAELMATYPQGVADIVL